MITKNYICFLLFVFLIIVSGCSMNAPTTPDAVNGTVSMNQVSDGGRQLWGLWEVNIDPDSLEASVTPMRFGEFHVNVRTFLEEGPCIDCLSVQMLIPQPYGFDVDLAITHPFPGLSYYVGFDVRGIIMLEGAYSSPTLGFLTTRSAAGDSALLNPDGWTQIFNANDYILPGILGYSAGKMVPPTWPDPINNLNAFKAFYSVGQSEADGGRRAFINGDTVVRTYELQFKEGDPLRFWYAVDASWEEPAGDEPYTVEDFPTSANCPEAYRMDLSVVSGELFADSGNVRIGLDLWDHQPVTEVGSIQYEAVECTDLVGIVMTPPLYVDGDMGHWEFNLQNSKGGLNPETGTELVVVAQNRSPDPNLGPVHGIGRLTIPVSGEQSGCNSELHDNNLGSGDFSGGTHMAAYDAIFVHDTGTINDGEFLGYISGYGGTVVATYIIDTTTPEQGDSLGPDWGNPHMLSWPVPVSIDIAEETGNFFIAWDDVEPIVEVWQAQVGKLAGETDASSNGRVFCLDTDGSGGFWNGYYPEMGFANGIKHFTPDGPEPGTLLEVTADHISLPETWGTPHELICIPGDKLLVLTGSYGQTGKIRSYDISVSPPEYVGEISDIFSGDLANFTYPERPCDMVADWSDPDLAHCRIVVMGNLVSGNTEFVKIDSDLNILAGPTAVAVGGYGSFDINPTTGDIALSPPDRGSPGAYSIIEQPADW